MRKKEINKKWCRLVWIGFWWFNISVRFMLLPHVTSLSYAIHINFYIIKISYISQLRRNAFYTKKKGSFIVHDSTALKKNTTFKIHTKKFHIYENIDGKIYHFIHDFNEFRPVLLLIDRTFENMINFPAKHNIYDIGHYYSSIPTRFHRLTQSSPDRISTRFSFTDISRNIPGNMSVNCPAETAVA